jgi:hypothetical protein
MNDQVPSPSLTAADLAAVYQIPVGTIYGWASTDKWRRTTTRPKRYLLDDAQASYERRRPSDDDNAASST